MKFPVKITLAVTVLLAAVLSLGGMFLVRQSFDSALARAVAQGTGVHLLEKYTVEAGLLDAGGSASDEALRRTAAGMAEYLEVNGASFAVLEDGKTFLYAGLPPHLTGRDVRDALDAGGQQGVIRKTEGGSYLLMESPIQTPLRSLTLVSAADITSLFTARDAQLRYLWRLEALLLAAAILATAGLSGWLTRPIRKLRRAARQIADGAYSQRTGVRGGDEIGDLARDFDRMAEAVQQRVEALGASVKQRDDFVAAFSHEVKTPITTLVGYADILRRTEEAPEVRRTAATYIYRESLRLEALGRKLMELMGLAEGELDAAPVAAKDLFGEVAASLTPQFPGARLACGGDRDVRLLVDRVLAGDLLRNLLSNALLAGPPGIPVTVHFRRGRCGCHVLVRDFGRGIPAGELARVTEPFYMVDKSRSRDTGGSGIGLALAQRIAALYGGGLRFRSRVGAGTVVRFCLPLAKGRDDHEG